MKKYLLLSALSLAFVAMPVLADEHYSPTNPSSSTNPYLQTTTNWSAGNGNSFGNVTQNGPNAAFTSTTSGGMLFNQNNIAGTSSLNGGSAWSTSTQDLTGGSGADFTMKLGNDKNGSINVASGHDFTTGIGNTSNVLGQHNSLTTGTSSVQQYGGGSQSFNGSGFTSGSGKMDTGASSGQTFTGNAMSGTTAAPGSYTALGTANMGSTSGSQMVLNVSTNGPGSANGSFGSSLTSTITQTVYTTGSTGSSHPH